MVETWRILPAKIPGKARETHALAGRRRNSWRKLLPILSIARFPAKRENSIAQFVASLPIPFTSCGLAILCELRHFRRYRGFGVRFEIENVVDPPPPIQPSLCRGGIELILIHRSIRLPNRFEQKSKRRGNIEIVIERFFKS